MTPLAPDLAALCDCSGMAQAGIPGHEPGCLSADLRMVVDLRERLAAAGYVIAPVSLLAVREAAQALYDVSRLLFPPTGPVVGSLWDDLRIALEGAK